MSGQYSGLEGEARGVTLARSSLLNPVHMVYPTHCDQIVTVIDVISAIGVTRALKSMPFPTSQLIRNQQVRGSNPRAGSTYGEPENDRDRIVAVLFLGLSAGACCQPFRVPVGDPVGASTSTAVCDDGPRQTRRYSLEEHADASPQSAVEPKRGLQGYADPAPNCAACGR